MTPWQLNVCLRGYAARQEKRFKEQAWHTWHIATLSRAKKIPKLSELTNVKAKKGMTANGLIAYLMNYNERLKEDGASSKTDSSTTGR